jgi:choline kinase
MYAIILAAGRGSRMGGLTSEQPKCLTTIAGRTLLDWQLAALREAGLNEIAVVRGYQAQQLKPSGCTFFENTKWSNTNMVATLACAREWLNRDDCLIAYSDILYHPDIITKLARHPGDLVISHDRDWLSLWRERFANPLEDAETFRCDTRGRLCEIGGRADTLEAIESQYMGLIKTTPAGWRQIQNLLANKSSEERNRLDMTAMFQRLIEQGVEIDAAPIRGRWCEVDCKNDLDIYQRHIAQANGWRHDWRWEALPL